MNLSRREFLTTVSATTVGAVMGSRSSLFGQEPPAAGPAPVKSATVVVVEGKDIPAMLRQGIEAMGGWAKYVKKGQKATVKPNSGWNSKPEQGGNASPVLVGEIVAACVASGASEVVVPEKTCSGPESFKASGIGEAVKKAGGRIYEPDRKEHFRSVEIPGGVTLKRADVVVDVLDTGCLISVPVAKVHGGATLTMAMKNWMGSVEDRGFWHRTNLHQCIADFCRFMKPSLVIMDATRILLTNGPRGPGKLGYPGQLIFGTDQVAVDAYGTTLFGLKPSDVQHIMMAHSAGIGCGDLSAIEIRKIKV